MKDTQMKAVQITINNPSEHGYTDEKITEILAQSRMKYACFCREIGEQGTEHIHIYIVFRSARRFSTLKKRFPEAHIEKALGSPSDNRDYLLKQGKWADTTKAETSIEGSFREFGELPEDSFTTKISDLEEILDDIKQGASTAEILEAHPKQLMKVANIEAARQAILAEKYKRVIRKVVVHFIEAPLSVDVLKLIYDNYPKEDICRITSYDKNNIRFDSYHGEDILIFDHFDESVPLPQIISILEGYPLALPARYSDRVACYTKVIFISRWKLKFQYNDNYKYPQAEYEAFQRLFDYLYVFDEEGNYKRYSLGDERYE